MLNMCDPPTHTRIRGLVSRDFTPKAVERLVPFLRAPHRADPRRRSRPAAPATSSSTSPPSSRCRRSPGSSASPKRTRTSCSRGPSTILDFRDRELDGTTDELAEAALGMVGYGADLIDEKRRDPAEDMLSAVVHATVVGADGEVDALTPAELSAFFSLLFVAGSETTRNSIAGGLLALIEHPDQLDRAPQADRSLIPSAVEEILRWTSATAYNRRTATVDVELGGQRIRAGEKTTHWYPSANRDEAVFDDPFRVRRRARPEPARRVRRWRSITASGAALARTEIRVMLEELLDRFSGFALAGPVEWGRSNKHTSIRHLPVTLTPI